MDQFSLLLLLRDNLLFKYGNFFLILRGKCLWYILLNLTFLVKRNPLSFIIQALSEQDTNPRSFSTSCEIHF